MELKSFFLIILLVAFCSCKTSELLPGYILNSSPNSADRPGRVYRLDNSNKTDILVQYLDVNPNSHPIYIPEKTSTKTVNTNALVSFISKIANTTASSEVNSNSRSQFQFKFKETKVTKLSDEELRPIYSELITQIKEDIKLFGLKTPKYFIVREAVTAKEMLINFTKNTSNKAEIKAKIDEYVSGSGSVQWINDNKNELNIKLDQGTFIFFKPEEIVFSTSIAGDTRIVFSAANKKDLEMLQIK